MAPRFTTEIQPAKGRGRPRARDVEYLDAVARECSVADWVIVVKRAKVDAQAGDARARQWLTDRLLLTPAPAALVDDAAGVAAVAELVAEFVPDPERAKRFALAIVRGLP
jgi:hypothetical protein